MPRPMKHAEQQQIRQQLHERLEMIQKATEQAIDQIAIPLTVDQCLVTIEHALKAALALNFKIATTPKEKTR